MFQANIIICPKCNHYFQNNIINGLELLDVVNRIESRKRMYCRLALDGIERIDGHDHNFGSKKKLILDNFNDFNRDVQTILGFGLEVE